MMDFDILFFEMEEREYNLVEQFFMEFDLDSGKYDFEEKYYNYKNINILI